MIVEIHWNHGFAQGYREFEGLNASSILDMAAERWVLDGANPFYASLRGAILLPLSIWLRNDEHRRVSVVLIPFVLRNCRVLVMIGS